MNGKVVGVAAVLAGLMALGSAATAASTPAPSWHIAKSAMGQLRRGQRVRAE